MAAPIQKMLGVRRIYQLPEKLIDVFRYNRSCKIGNVPYLAQRRWFGQPASQTHPHLINEGEVTPGISKTEYVHRRTGLMTSILEKAAQSSQNHIVILPSASKLYMSYDIPYPFRQNTEFLYMSGFQEPDSVLVMHTSENGYKSILFVPKKDPDKELWDGPRSGIDGALELTGVTEAYNTEQLEKYLYSYCKSHKNYYVWYHMSKPVHKDFHKNVISEFLSQDGQKSVQNPTQLVQQMRLIKSPSEIELMKTTTQIASEAFIEVMKSSKPNINESVLFAKMDYECRLRGAEMLAYPPVVAGGDRANIIHYINNNQLVRDGQMVLMDAGCEYHGYTSDITRTWPVSGKFSSVQRRLYLALLEIQEHLISHCRLGMTLGELYTVMIKRIAHLLLIQKLVPLHVSRDETKLRKALGEFCPHDVGHYLGMDVHDTALINKNTKLQPGMVITIEPGLYIRADNQLAPEECRGIGIRIEDNVLITDSEPIVLTSGCPKHPDDIEHVMEGI